MPDEKSQEIRKSQKLSERKITLVDEAYSPKTLPKGMNEPELQGFVGHQQPSNSSSNQSELLGSTPTSERSGESETARPSTIPADQEQK